MGTNFISAFTSANTFDPVTMNSQSEALDRVLTYTKNIMMSCAGAVTFGSGTLAWSGQVSILFTNNEGIAVHNVIATGSIVLAQTQYAYVVLNDTDGSTLTVQKATYSAGSPSALLDYNKLVLGYYDSSGGFFASPNLTIAGMNLPASPGQGDLIYYNGSAWTLLAPGTAGQLLATEGSSANPQWVTPASGFPAAPVQGNLVFYDGSAWVLLAPGTAGQVLTTEGANANPQWATSPTGMPVGVAEGNIIYYNGNSWAVLPPGIAGQVLTTEGSSAIPQWTTPSSGSGMPSGVVGGNIVYYNGSAWVVLAPGTAGQVLTTEGSGAIPQWTTASGGSGGASSSNIIWSLL